jgi:hypothetical protein
MQNENEGLKVHSPNSAPFYPDPQQRPIQGTLGQWYPAQPGESSKSTNPTIVGKEQGAENMGQNHSILSQPFETFWQIRDSYRLQICAC